MDDGWPMLDLPGAQTEGGNDMQSGTMTGMAVLGLLAFGSMFWAFLATCWAIDYRRRWLDMVAESNKTARLLPDSPEWNEWYCEDCRRMVYVYRDNLSGMLKCVYCKEIVPGQPGWKPREMKSANSI